MAVNFADVSRTLVIVKQVGTTLGGKAVNKSYSFKGLSETAAADKVQAAGNALAGLMAGDLVSIYVKDTNEVLENA